MNKASNAVLALCRAFYGKRLIEKDYGDLASSRTLSEFASVLRSRTAYAECLENVIVSTSALEAAFEKFTLERYLSICRYELAIGNAFYDYFITQIEISEILRATLFMFGDGMGDYLVTLSPFVARKVSVDLYGLSKCSSFEDIARLLEPTEYGKLYKSCLSSPNASYMSFENSFEQYFDDYLVSLTKKCYHGSERKEVLEIIKVQNDIRAIKKQLRICKYYPYIVPVDTKNIPVPVTTALSDKLYRQMLSASTVSEIYEVISRSPYKKCLENGDENLSFSLDAFLFGKCKKQLRFSSNPGTVTYCYLFLSENERKNLTYITEGIKYELSPEEIKSKLLYE